MPRSRRAVHRRIGKPVFRKNARARSAPPGRHPCRNAAGAFLTNSGPPKLRLRVMVAENAGRTTPDQGSDSLGRSSSNCGAGCTSMIEPETDTRCPMI